MGIKREKKDQDALNRWQAKNQRIDQIKDDYLKLIEQTKQWFKKNYDELRSISREKFDDKSREYVHNCNLFVDSIADELYWFQGKTPPGGFKNGAMPKSLDQRFPKVKE